MPTFVLIKNKEETARLKGASPHDLETLVIKNAPPANSSGEASGSTASASDVSYHTFTWTLLNLCVDLTARVLGSWPSQLPQREFGPHSQVYRGQPVSKHQRRLP